ncbi:phospholipase [Prauserella marina]|uniref:Patatin-like phospholipase n=1 Tax=Prauserella marina TaxID=530584 RepID=A0A222VRP6_9PSEU|nr:patatin-like phospholipase family protein [Prauserella marina]ASR36512.1 phospholipase [Prauserella marina]PWV73896.1 patatin-like phospholipase [Prauserella marina]SDD58443.1 Patatin-like phospholipase [Prauserella marina]
MSEPGSTSDAAPDPEPGPEQEPAEGRSGTDGQSSTAATAPRRSVAAAVTSAAIALPVAAAFLPSPSDLTATALAGGGQPVPLPEGTATAATWDLLFVVMCGVALWLGTTVALWVARTPNAIKLSRYARIATVVVVITGLLRDLVLLAVTGWHGIAPWALEVATAATVVEFSAILFAGLVAATAVVVVVWRGIAHTQRELAGQAEHDMDTVPPAPLESDDPPVHAGDRRGAHRWHSAYTVPGVDPEMVNQRWDRGEHTTGVCLSGGGIRAASVAMGALQSLRAELLSADYVVSVSGGGYTAGAFQQALTGAPPPSGLPGEVVRDPETVYQQGSAELDHLRRHSSYLADTRGQLMGALGRIARGLLLSLTVLFGPAVVFGVASGWLYAQVPLTDVSLAPSQYPVPRPGALYAIGFVGVTTFLLALYSRGAAERRAFSARLVPAFGVLAALIGVVTLGIPLLVWLAAWLLDVSGEVPGVLGPVGTVLLTYAAAIASIFWRRRAMLGQRASGLLRLRKSGGVPAAVPSGMLQRLLVMATTGVLVLVWLLLFAGSATTLGEPAALWSAAVVGAVVLVLGGLFDVTSLSLHPFYRERLASAFAVRTVRRDSDGQVVAVPYTAAERTTLSAYGVTAEGVRFPKVVFAAAANLTGEARTPPGLGAVSYTMSADWTGGPDIGWVRTTDLERAVTPRFRRDLTVQGAVAVSGAAFASAMGRSSKWFQALLAVSGARLGAWLPNPAFVRHAHQAAERGDWAFPWLPRARRLPYLAREVLGLHPHRDRLLHISDGGHYDNLGLVELFRRRCTRIFCVDASNDAPPTATTFAEALTLAQQELGIRVELDEPWTTEQGTGEVWEGGESLAGRLSRSPLITGTVHYPAESGLAGGVTGRLVVARALLWKDLPYSLLSYAMHNPEFPNDSTGDQWFDDAKFSAYTELGRRIGDAAKAAAGDSAAR